jgi:pilus assembly protein CpaB
MNPAMNATPTCKKASGLNRVALIVSLAMAALGSLLLYVYLRRFEQEVSGGPKVGILVAVKPIAAGQVVTDDMLGSGQVPQAYVEDRAVRESERSRVIGLRMSSPLRTQETLQWTDLALAADDRRDLSSLVQPGMRAVTVRATTQGAFALIRPGDRADVLATMPQGDLRESVVLLQNVLVLAVGLDTGAGADPASKRPELDRNDQITLSLHVPEAQLLALAQEKGHLSVALRSPDDPRITEGLADMNSTALTDPQSRAVVQSARVRPVQLERGGRP